MELINYFFVLGAGILAGFINVFAGGGSLITLPVLIFTGLPTAVANGTNKVGLLFGGLSGATNFHKNKIVTFKEVLPLVPFAVAGSLLGSHFAIAMSDAVFKVILSVVMLLVLILTLFKPHKILIRKLGRRDNAFILYIGFFITGFYGGFVQAGMGFLIITVLSLCTSYDLIKINGLKVNIGGVVIVLLSLVVFIWYGKVNYLLGVILAVGNGIGAWMASSLAVNSGEKIAQPILIVMVVIMAVKLSGLFDFI